MNKLVEWLASQTALAVDPALFFDWKGKIKKGKRSDLPSSRFELTFPEGLATSFDHLVWGAAWSERAFYCFFARDTWPLDTQIDLWIDTRPSVQPMHRYAHHFILMRGEEGAFFLYEKPLSWGGLYREPSLPSLLTACLEKDHLVVSIDAAALFGYQPEVKSVMRLAFRITASSLPQIVFPTGLHMGLEESTQLWTLFEYA